LTKTILTMQLGGFNMKLKEAIVFLKQGKRIKRARWEYYIDITDSCVIKVLDLVQEDWVVESENLDKAK